MSKHKHDLKGESNMKTAKFNDFQKEAKRREFKTKVKNKLINAKVWVINNKELVIGLTPVIIGGLSTITKVVGKNINLRKQESIKNTYCYDRSLGHYWSLKRDLTNKEWLEVDRRKKQGERLADILSEMRVLK